MKLKKRFLTVLLAVVMVMSSLSLDRVAKAAGSSGTGDSSVAYVTKVADASTQDVWSQLLNSYRSTQYLGRVWTDKTVAAGDITLQYKLTDSGATTNAGNVELEMDQNADFQIALSAMSSTASFLTATNGMADIVMVLDTSASMANPTGGAVSYSSQNLDSLDKNQVYVTVAEATMHSGNWTNDSLIYVYYDFVAKAWKGVTYCSYADATPEFQTYSETELKKKNLTLYHEQSCMTVLKESVISFLKTLWENERADADNQVYQISLITFSGFTEGNKPNGRGEDVITHLNLSKVEDAVIQEAIKDVASLIPGYATCSADGLSAAQAQLSSDKVRSGAGKYLLFFTDGEPNGTDYAVFDTTEAADAVEIAKTIKNDLDTTIYGIGASYKASADDLIHSEITTHYRHNDWEIAPDPTTLYPDYPKQNDPSQDVSGSEELYNYFMQAVSSNYPNATATSIPGTEANDWYRTGTWTLTLNDKS